MQDHLGPQEICESARLVRFIYAIVLRAVQGLAF